MMNFTKEKLIRAIEEIDLNPKLLKNRGSSTYDLVYNEKKYPPILVLSVANKLNGGKELYLKDFNNNVEEPFKILKENNFKIIKKSNSMKEEFEKFILVNNKEGSQKAPSYIRALELLDDILIAKDKDKLDGNNSIYETESKITIEKLYKFILNEQNNEKGIFENEEPKSYWKSKFYSAAINSYLNFLTSRNQVVNLEKTPFSYKSFQQKTEDAGLIFSEKMVARFVASLCTKPFVICSGLSGSGKTKLAQSFVQWICESEEQYKIIPVGADWTNREPLLGFPNGLEKEKYVKPDSGALDIIIKALKPENENKPFFLILDEMNLSHVERYFADFLSIMESKDKIKLYSGDKLRDDIEKEIKWPTNLFIIGTVNIDETTYMFSPKVLDRANVIEFRISEDDLKTYLNSTTDLDMKKFLGEDKKTGLGANMGSSFLQLAKENPKSKINNNETLLKFFKELQKTGAEFGYRTASEINRLIAILNELSIDNNTWDGETIVEEEYIDIAIMQKLLPKLHGSRNKLTKILPVLGGFCIAESKKEKIKEIYFDKVDDVDFKGDKDIIYKLSFEKICRMYKNAVENGYASYAEA